MLLFDFHGLRPVVTHLGRKSVKTFQNQSKHSKISQNNKTSVKIPFCEHSIFPFKPTAVLKRRRDRFYKLYKRFVYRRKCHFLENFESCKQCYGVPFDNNTTHTGFNANWIQRIPDKRFLFTLVGTA